MNRPTYFEIHVDDLDRAKKFYSEVFGWKFDKWENKVAGAKEYYRITTGSEEVGIDGGMLKRMGPVPAESMTVNSFVITISVANIDESISKVEKAGGILAMPKFGMPETGWVAYYKDTEGNIFGLFQQDVEIK